MWSSRLFWKLFLSYAALNIVSAIILGVVVSRWCGQLIEEQVGQQLRTSALLVREDVMDLLSNGRSPELQSYVRVLGQKTGMRITLVGMDGSVLAESEKTNLLEIEKMDNHNARPEIIMASQNGEGSTERPSTTLGEPMKYYAIRAMEGERSLGIVRTASSMEVINDDVGSVKRLIWTVAILISISVLVLTYWLVARIIHPVATLTDAAAAITAGDYTHRVYVAQQDELGVFADAFNRMNQQMATRVSTLRESRERLVAVLGGMQEGVLAVDSEQCVLFANDAASQFLDFTPGEVEGRSLHDVIGEKSILESITQEEFKEETQKYEIELDGGRGRILGISVSVLPGHNQPGAILVMQDITELRRLESIRQEFVANVSHELKTPLSSIKAYSETLRIGAVNDPEHNILFVRRIEEQADRLHQLILDLLSLARIESDQQAYDIGKIHLPRIAEACVKQYLANALAKEISLQTNGSDAALYVQADEEGLRQILDNLVDNAIKYTPQNGQITVSWHSDQYHAFIEVSDTGIGISESDQARIFERFYRVDKARSRELGGTGLGLSIVKHMVQAFSGNISVQSRLGQGSKFIIQLPLSS